MSVSPIYLSQWITKDAIVVCLHISKIQFLEVFLLKSCFAKSSRKVCSFISGQVHGERGREADKLGVEDLSQWLRG